MKKSILTFGLYSALFVVVFTVLGWVISPNLTVENCDKKEMFGFAAILVSMSFIYFGIRYYRDQVNNRAITFGRAISVGLLIMTIPAAAFGLLDTLYGSVINPAIWDQYAHVQAVKLQKAVPADQLQAQLKALNEQVALYKNPVMDFLVMFFSVAVTGVVITLISALILRRKEK